MSLATRCDLFISGGGVAGSTAALKAAREGLSVILAEPLSSIGAHTCTKIDITESTGILPILKELKLRAQGTSNKTKWFSPRHELNLRSKIRDVYVKRGQQADSFENQALRAAKRLGASVLLDSEVIDYTLKPDGSAKKVKLRRKNKIIEIEPKAVIIAEGENAPSLPKLGFRKSPTKIKMLGYGVYSDELELPEAAAHIFFDSQRIPAGYFYAVRNKGVGVASIVVDTRFTEEKSIRKWYSEYLQHDSRAGGIVKGAKEKGIFSGSGSAYSLESLARANSLVVGNSAGLLDPLFGYGVRQAIFSGYHAAKLIGEELSSAGQSRAGPNYEKLMNETLGKEIAAAWRGRAFFESMTNHDFDVLLSALTEANSVAPADEILEHPFQRPALLFKLLIRHPHLLKLATRAWRAGV